ncbi:AP-1 complex subunit sigma-3 isoform X2 [Pipistrellus kuhlii]|uniref:AP-1 complex subunit sigma-3 isoform X2 n=1 Tax=Pipistrellus kuhlii TaxID=59472 RepID=UPI001E2741B8|nr:AP-1 complex subunit sigma-3 isoform X2 [Pipistrellus kuhlii]
MIHFILLFSRQGKLRLQKWYTTLPDKERKKITREIVQIVLSRSQRMSSFIDWKELKLVYKRYASLYFCCAVESQDNELLTLEIVHRYVELLDKYFGNVCELDIIFNFEKAYFILDEFIIGGEIQETSKKSAVKAIEDSDMLQELQENTPGSREGRAMRWQKPKKGHQESQPRKNSHTRFKCVSEISLCCVKPLNSWDCLLQQ